MTLLYSDYTVFPISCGAMMPLLHHTVDATTVTPTPIPVYPNIADTLRKLLCKFQVIPTNSSKVTATFVPTP